MRMDSKVITRTNTDPQILSFDVLDEFLERVANIKQSAFTLVFCTSNWDSCGMPHSVGGDRGEIAQ
jgi:hypothetical protein